jgi:hypothetical protein
MSTVLAVYNTKGCLGRCDARCHEARGTVCRCVCGGANHGVGVEQAAENSAQMGEEIARSCQDNAGRPAAVQLPLPL